MRISLPKIYAITDKNLSGLSHSEQVRQFISGGAKLVQIRDKISSSRELFDDAITAVEFAHENGVTILINDRVDIALIAGADGVHLGQQDISVSAAREVLGGEAIIGLSTHDIDHAKEAANGMDCDYIAFGPIFATSTKTEHEPVVGLDKLRAVRAAVGNRPLVAIGGIKASDLRSVYLYGADSAALISEFFDLDHTISEKFRVLSALA